MTTLSPNEPTTGRPAYSPPPSDDYSAGHASVLKCHSNRSGCDSAPSRGLNGERTTRRTPRARAQVDDDADRVGRDPLMNPGDPVMGGDRDAEPVRLRVTSARER